MKTQNRKTEKKVENFKNATLTGFAKFKAELQVKQEKLEFEKQNRKVVRTRSTHITLQNNVLLLILNAISGISISEIMETKPVNCGKKTAFNIHTINRDWNVESHEQKEMLRLWELGLEVGFTINTENKSSESLKGKQNNLIKIENEFVKPLAEFLLENANVKPEQITRKY